ncbi:hypothetical protein OROGR_025654 [Orobanche gracilis]
MEKAYDKVPREILWWALMRRGISKKYIDIIKDMYEAVTRVCELVLGRLKSSQFELEYIKTKEGVETKLKLWRRSLESKGFKLSRNKTVYLENKFSGNRSRDAREITLDGRKVQSVDCFCYLGSIIQADRGLDGDVAQRIKSGWLKWKSATSFLCNPDMPNRLKGKFNRTAIRSALLYGTEYWAVKQWHVHKMSVAEMRMLRWMCGHTRKDRARNEIIRTKVGVTCIEKKMRENRLRWFGHVKWMGAPVRRLERWQEETIREIHVSIRRYYSFTCVEKTLGAD